MRVLVPFAIVIALGYAPLFDTGWQALGSLPRYLAEEYFNPGLVRSIVDVPGASLMAMAVWTGAVAWRASPATFVDRMVPLIGGLVLLSPNVFPWYVLWLVPFLAVTPSVWWIAFTGSVAFAYAFFLSQPWGIPHVGAASRDHSDRSGCGLVAGDAAAPGVCGWEFTGA